MWEDRAELTVLQRFAQLRCWNRSEQLGILDSKEWLQFCGPPVTTANEEQAKFRLRGSEFWLSLASYQEELRTNSRLRFPHTYRTYKQTQHSH